MVEGGVEGVNPAYGEGQQEDLARALAASLAEFNDNNNNSTQENEGKADQH